MTPTITATVSNCQSHLNLNGTDEAQESDERGRKEERRKLAEGVLIDGFWLVGTLLEPLSLPNPINDAAGSAATPSVAPSSSGEGYAALSALLKAPFI